MSLGKYLLQSADKHIIRCRVNKSEDSESSKSNITSDNIQLGIKEKNKTK